MKSLSLQRPLILMLIGVPGAGKSFFARQFADTFSAPLVSQDYIRSNILAAPEYSFQEETMIQAIQRQQIAELLKTQKTFIVDGGMNTRNERQDLAKVAKSNGYDTLTVWVQTDEPTSQYRATRRNMKRPGDVLNQSLSKELFMTLTKQFNAPSGKEPFVVISGKHTYATQARTVLKKLVSPRPATTEKPVHTGDRDAPQAPKRHNVIIG